MCVYTKVYFCLKSIFMMITTKLNPVQLHLLQMFEHLQDEQQLLDLKKVLAAFYAQKVDEMSDQLWDEKGLSNEDMDVLLTSHLRKGKR